MCFATFWSTWKLHMHRVGESWGRNQSQWTCGCISSDSSGVRRGTRQLSPRQHGCSFQVYQSLEHELQKHVSRQDTLQQCQAWLSAVQPDLKPSPHPPLSRAEAVKQVGDSWKFMFMWYIQTCNENMLSAYYVPNWAGCWGYKSTGTAIILGCTDCTLQILHFYKVKKRLWLTAGSDDGRHLGAVLFN